MTAINVTTELNEMIKRKLKISQSCVTDKIDTLLSAGLLQHRCLCPTPVLLRCMKVSSSFMRSWRNPKWQTCNTSSLPPPSPDSSPQKIPPFERMMLSRNRRLIVGIQLR